jgi:hypothetical protein
VVPTGNANFGATPETAGANWRGAPVGAMLGGMRGFCALGFAAAIASCGSSGGAGVVDGGSSIAIVAPADGASVSIATSSDVPVTFTVVGFTLAAPGLCGHVDDGCGHVHVLVDGDACNAPGQNFNNAFPPAGSATSPATAIALLATCPVVAGSHTIRLELHRDDHSAVTGAPSAAITVIADSAVVDAGPPTDADAAGTTDAGTDAVTPAPG